MSKDSSSPIHAEITARASLEAKLSVQAKVPEKATGRLVDAITDLFRPISEGRGLRADQIRLQREDVLIEIARKARVRLALEDGAFSPIPNKILIPLLEKASLEEKDSLLVDLWADLLVSSAVMPDYRHPRFVQILSELTPRDALTLQQLALGFGATEKNERNIKLKNLDGDMPIDTAVFIDELDEPDTVRSEIEGYGADSIADFIKNVHTMLVKQFNMPNLLLLGVYLSSNEMFYKLDGSGKIDVDVSHDSLDVLASLGLILNRNKYVRTKILDIRLEYIQLSPFGEGFLCACDHEFQSSL